MSKCKECYFYQYEHPHGYNCVLMECAKKYTPKNKNHRCYGCVWGTNTGGQYFCMLPRCLPKLGNFGKGVIKDDPKKENP